MKKDYKVTKYVEQSCSECILRIEAYKPEEHDSGWFDIHVISNHQTKYHMGWRVRIKNAWKVLRGDYSWSGFELWTPEEAAEFLIHVDELLPIAFPELRHHDS